MNNIVHHRTSCRLCSSVNLRCVVKLNPIPLSEAYGIDAKSAKAAARYPIDVYMCGDCGHVQQLDVIDPAVLWSSYTYYSGDSKGMPEHFKGVSDKVLGRLKLAPGSLVIDIGSNDGSLLMNFKDIGCRVLGIDPATEAAQRANDRGIETICALMSEKLADTISDKFGLAQAIFAFNVFAHADNLSEMVMCVEKMLSPEGLFFFEAQYLLDMIEGMLVATIFHEHISHHSVAPLIPFFDKHGLELISIDRAKIQHGSMIGTVQKKGGARKVEASVTDALEVERAFNLSSFDTLELFGDKINSSRKRLQALLIELKREGKSVAGFGAARSAPTLIAQFSLEGFIDFIVDDHPQKIHKYMVGEGVVILPTVDLLNKKPDYTIILAWVHSQKIIDDNRAYLESGGKFIVLCPDMSIVTREGVIGI